MVMAKPRPNVQQVFLSKRPQNAYRSFYTHWIKTRVNFVPILKVVINEFIVSPTLQLQSTVQFVCELFWCTHVNNG